MYRGENTENTSAEYEYKDYKGAIKEEHAFFHAYSILYTVRRIEMTFVR
jgi:hypothetical protein